MRVTMARVESVFISLKPHYRRRRKSFGKFSRNIWPSHPAAEKRKHSQACCSMREIHPKCSLGDSSLRIHLYVLAKKAVNSEEFTVLITPRSTYFDKLKLAYYCCSMNKLMGVGDLCEEARGTVYNIHGIWYGLGTVLTAA